MIIRRRHHKTIDISETRNLLMQISRGSAMLLLGVLLGAFIFRRDIFSYTTNLYTEIIGIVVTVVIVDQLAEQREIRRMKKQLIRQAGSRSNTIAISAIEELRANGWLIGKKGLLRGQELIRANLEVTRLSEANLEYADLSKAKLKDARLRSTNLKNANLYRVDLTDANLRGTNFTGANLENATFERARFNTDALMPDGKHWSENTDITRFTDPDHLHFWRSDDPASPAYFRTDEQATNGDPDSD